MSAQYAVVFFPSDDLVAEGVGPFRSLERAEAAAARIATALDGEEGGERFAAAAPQVVSLTSERVAVERYGLEEADR